MAIEIMPARGVEMEGGRVKFIVLRRGGESGYGIEERED